MGCAGVLNGVLNGVDVTVGDAVCVGEELAVGVGVWAEAVGVGDCASAVPVAVAVAEASGVCVLSAEDVAVGLGSWASAMPPSTAANRPAQQRADGEDLLESHEASYTRVERSRDGGDSAQLRHCAPRA